MIQIRPQILGKTGRLTFFAILALCFFSAYRARPQDLPFHEPTKTHPKIESSLARLLEEHSEGVARSQQFAEDLGIQVNQEGMITLYLLPETGKTQDTIDAEGLIAYGGEVIKSGDHIIKAAVPVSAVKEIADHVRGVSFVKLPDKPRANVVSEGVKLTGASVYHASGFKGQNVKVAVIDLGFARLSTAIEYGVLPETVSVIDCTGPSCVEKAYPWDLFESEDHGTAVAEVVHDMAPGAKLYLIKVEDTLDLKQAKDFCIANGIKVINHSIGWVNTNFYDGSCYNDNPVCAANDAFANGILWVNSAGNYAKSHYEAIFSDLDGDGWHNVAPGNPCIYMDVLAGELIDVSLTWDAWPETDQDYDLSLSFAGLEVASSETLQTGTQPPVESIYYMARRSGTYCLSVKKHKTTANHGLEIFSINHDLSPHVSSSSIIAPADATGVVAVAAISKTDWTTGPQKDYSSQGPTTDGRAKPEISGPSDVSNYVYRVFGGTSVASPHVAGAAALLLSKNPSYNVLQLRSVLLSSAIDMGTNGEDNIYGYGRVNLPVSTGPDLTGSWATPVTQVCRKTLRGTLCTVKGTFTVKNIGNGNASSTAVNFYLSGDGTDYDINNPVKESPIRSLRAGRSKAIRLSYTLAAGRNAAGQYVIAVIDKDSAVTEVDETNNIIVSDPIPQNASESIGN